MAIRYEDATKLYQQTLKEISHDETSWTDFLKSACRNYRLPFADMVMIYAQRPDATAVLEIEDWNKRYGLWIKPKSKGIAVFDSSYNNYARLKYYFDISDTRQTRFYRPVPIWELKEEYEEEVINTLKDNFGPLDNENDLAQAVLSASGNVVEDNISDYLKELLYCKTDSFLEDLDEQNTEIIYKSLLTASVAYMTLSRCDINADDYISNDILRQIAQFNTRETLNALGIPAKDISQMVIGEIRKTVLSLIRDENRTIVDNKKNSYNKTEKDINDERSHEDNETRLYSNGRVSDPQFNIEKRERSSVRQIWADEEELSSAAPSDTVHQSVDITDSQSAPVGDRGDGKSEERTADETVDGADGSNGRIERIKSDGVDSEDEQHRGNDSRDHHKGTDLQLDKNEDNEEAGNYKIPAFFTLIEYEHLIKYDRFRSHKNKDIQAVFEFYNDKDKRTNYVKESFKVMIVEEIYHNQRLGYYHDQGKDMLRVWKGGYANPDYEDYVSWQDVTSFIEDMIDRNVYLSIPLKPLPTAQKQQLNLFDMEPVEPSQNNKEKQPFTMPQYIIDAVLSEGTEEKDSKMKIAIHFSLDQPVEQNAEFLKKLYYEGSNGFIINNRSLSYKWNSDGMQITWGDGIVNAYDKQTLTWQDVAKSIRSLLDQGRYISQNELDQCTDYEYQQASEHLWYMCQDMDFDETDHMMELRQYYHKGFPDGTAQMAKLLKDKEFLDRAINALTAFNDDYQNNPDFMRHHWRMYAPDRILPVIKQLTMPHIKFKATDYKEPHYTYFITQDTIDSVIASQHRVHQKYDTLSFFLNNKDKKERIKFLKDMWGISGSSDYDSDSKGLKIKTGSYNKPYAKVLLKWKDVEQRLSYLIERDKYLNDEQKAGMNDYEIEVLARNIYSFFCRLPLNNPRPYNTQLEDKDKNNEIKTLLKDPSNTANILDMMQIALLNTAEFDKNYENMMKYFNRVQDFYQGTYTLFNEKKTPIIDTPYEPANNLFDSLARSLAEFAQIYDPYDFADQYEDFQDAVQNQKDTLNDIEGLQGFIKFMNAVIIEEDDTETVAAAKMLREELSIYFALEKGSNLSSDNEIRYSYRPYISQEEPRYNTGDFVFIIHNHIPVYGTIELIDEDEIVINLYDDNDLEISKEDFESDLRHDYRNEYLYDQNRPLMRVNDNQEQDLIVADDKERNTLGYQNYVLLKRIAPLIINNQATEMIFRSPKELSTISITLNEDMIIITHNNDEQYLFKLDNSLETLNIREITTDGETTKVTLFNEEEVDDYNEEQQMNESANKFIKNIANDKYILTSILFNGDGKETVITYGYDGNITSFDGSDTALSSYLENYHDDPIGKISSLIPILETGKENIQLVKESEIAQKNYNLLKQIAPLIITGESEFMRFTAGKHDLPLDIEIIDDRISMTHYLETDDSLLTDTNMEFVLDTDQQLFSARTFEKDNPAYYQSVSTNGNEVVDTDTEKELNEYANKWLNSIIDKEYHLEQMRIFLNNYPTEIEYGTDGLISNFDGSDDDLKYFREQYDSDPQNRISILVAKHNNNSKDLPSQKELVEDVGIAEVTNIPNKVHQPTSDIASHKLYPEISNDERHDFVITNMDLGAGGPKEKYKANVKAIQLLKELEIEHRLATPEEQEILSRFVGWGSLADAFDQTKPNWKNEYLELKDLLNDKQYRAARESTLTAFYTPPIVIQSIYHKLSDMGLKTGNILEPSCGIGHFFGMKPNDMDCHFYGVELDEISGKIAQHLYQNATIAIQPFENTDVPDNLFDAVVGNVPFGQIPIHDPRYNKNKFMIHDYFFAKALDKVKTGGIVILLTSKFTMDKQNSDVRKYIAQRAELLGAVRLPDNTFMNNAGTRITSDILILQKRERPLVYEPEWIYLDTNEDGLTMNSYFVSHPEMVLGTMVEETSQYGKTTSCKAIEGVDLSQSLAIAMDSIEAKINTEPILFTDEEDQSIPADPTVRNFSYCIVDGTIYYRENSRMYPSDMSLTAENRVRGMIGIRDCMRELIDLQTNEAPIHLVNEEQQKLNSLYDDFSKNYGIINSRGNKLAFQDDSSYSLLCSLEILNDDRTFKKKADIFYKQTIKAKKVIQSVDTASEALMVCIAEKAHVDFDFMSKISSFSKDELIEKLEGVIFPNPEKLNENGIPVYETADEYLSGNVRTKLAIAKQVAKQNPELYQSNVEALEKVQPEPIKASDISLRLGTTWIPTDVYRQFIFHLLETPSWKQKDIHVIYLAATEEWNVTRKSLDSGVRATKTFGTHRINAYKIIENTLNLRDVKIFDTKLDDEGKEIRVLNKKETAIAQDKQDIIKSRFIEWVWSDPDRRERLTKIYNEKFNSIRNRTYDGSHLSFTGMNTDIQLRKHQIDAIARILYGGNTLLAHSVGAGKTFEMIGAGMEAKRLGLCSKPIYVVPNNIINDFASDFYRLYPSANILVATTDTLSKNNRHQFFSRISTGEWDGVIVTHSQFIKMPISVERQIKMMEDQIEEITNSIEAVKNNNGERYTVKQLEGMKKRLKEKMQKLNDNSKKDDILCFEQLGIDMMFVDEADLFKNLFLFSKMRNVSGISQTNSQRASDLFMKTRYLDELTNYRGVVFATGTPVANSMAELYTMQRYLQYNMLQEHGLESFDAWASTFGETTTAMELTPEGNGFRLKTRFSRFYNLPELMTLFKEVADIQTADMLQLPTPNMHKEVISVPATNEQKDMIKALGDRAEDIRNRKVDPHIDNMLKITNDGRKLALDQRIINPLLPDNPNSKVNACVDNIYRIWKEYKDENLTQIMFCDLSTPNGKNEFNVYDDIKMKLIAKGIPEEEVEHIHIAKTEKQKQDLFSKVRQGKVRVINGSTSKMGAGTNIQDRLVALHDLDCPWRPRDLEQRHGRIARQGNLNSEASIYTYVTEGTFDSYLYQTIEKKQTFISQVFTSKTPQRVMEEIDEAVLNYAEIKAIASGDPKIMERCNLEQEINKLNVLKASFLNQKYEYQDAIIKKYPQQISQLEETIEHLKLDIELRNQNPLHANDDFVGMTLNNVFIRDKAEAGSKLIEQCQTVTSPDPILIGEYRSFELYVFFDSFHAEYKLQLKGHGRYQIDLSTDKYGNIIRINNVLDGLEKQLLENENALVDVKNQLASAKIEAEKPFEREDELQRKTKEFAKLTMELKIEEKEPNIIDADEIDSSTEKEISAKSKDYER